MVLLVLAGLVTAGIGAYFVMKGIRQQLGDDIRLPQRTAPSAVVVLAVFGYAAKGVALGALGVLLVIAAVTVNPGAASGLDGALKSLVAGRNVPPSS